jgi:pimeloyl-ACP methyl ester carboxylesterase
MPTVETNGIETYYEDYGSGTPIVVLHGATANHQTWAEQLKPLTDEYRILTYDLRGHGNTGGSDYDRYTLDMYVEDLAAFIDSLHLTEPVVLGHSMGGMIGYAFADAYPRRLSALITVGAMTPETFSTKERLYREVFTRVLMPLMGNERVVNVAQWIQTTLFSDGSAVDMDDLQQLRDEHDCNAPEVSDNERSKILPVARQYFESSWMWELTSVPVLMLYGENEPFIGPHADYLEQALDNCRSIEIPEASHNSQVDNPEFIRSQIRDFLTE